MNVSVGRGICFCLRLVSSSSSRTGRRVGQTIPDQSLSRGSSWKILKRSVLPSGVHTCSTFCYSLLYNVHFTCLSRASNVIIVFATYTCVQDEIDCEGNANLLKESDFIAFFDQFPFTDLYQYILMVPMEGMS